MIDQIKQIMTQDVSKEIWKNLRYFLDNEYTTKLIKKNLNITEDKFDKFIKKQARQISFCIRQAEEYFLASTQVGLATRPLLMYYGAVNLSQALFLLKKDGNFSLDKLREEKKHSHHGLEIIRGNIERANTKNINEFFQQIQCQVYFNQGKPWGQFPLFYDSLVSPAIKVEVEIYDSTFGSSFLKRNLSMNSNDVAPISGFIGKKFNIFDLIKNLPDLYYELFNMEITPNLSRGEVSVRADNRYAVRDGKQEYVGTDEKWKYIINGILPKDRTLLLEYYKQKEMEFRVLSEVGNHLHLECNYNSDKKNIFVPDIVDDMFGNKFFITKTDEYIIEPSIHFMILYCLGMVSRYYPDVWMKAIDENVLISEFTNSFLNISYRKLPNLILDQLTGFKHSFI
ncbi:YaaC family protein [Bacillus sp. ISL-46]|uniref:YaaC family protein n=1 Tax=Bacillus sp. ISL-46 TaxID=2819129 RepID=UPI001BEC7468|nr:YaaC family protein [Bacillus sp. ISL-46]MBT2722299.1 hypothetical protein [Bacillus sp. ISL-46]